MKEKKSYQVYRTIMIITLTAFITFILTSIFISNQFEKDEHSNKEDKSS